MKKPSSTDMGVGVAPAVAGWDPVVAAANVPVAGTSAPPPEMSPVVLSMALETTADNLYLQVSAGDVTYPN